MTSFYISNIKDTLALESLQDRLLFKRYNGTSYLWKIEGYRNVGKIRKTSKIKYSLRYLQVFLFILSIYERVVDINANFSDVSFPARFTVFPPT